MEPFSGLVRSVLRRPHSTTTHRLPGAVQLAKEVGQFASAKEPQSKPGQMKVNKGQSQPEIVAAAFDILYMVLGRLF